MEQVRCPLSIYSPGSKLEWGNCEFLDNPVGPTEPDFFITFASIPPRRDIYCAPENTLMIVGEPLEKKLYPQRFYTQYQWVIDTHLESRHPRVQLFAPCIGWEVGFSFARGKYLFGYPELKALNYPAKRNQISVVCSANADTPGQRRRLAFLAELKRQLGDQIVHFGRGFTPVDDKMEAILPYRYHLVLENCQTPHYWTERLSDTYLGWAFPFYVGCPNLQDYFPASSFCALNPDEPEKAVQLIRAMLAEPLNDERLTALTEARRRVLEEYNPLANMARWGERFFQPNAPRRQLSIWSHKAFRPFPQDWLFRLRHR